MAHPLASKIGAKFRLRSFKYAIIIAGPEISNNIPAKAIGIFHQVRPKNPAITDVKAELIAPIAKPIAAKIPTNLPTSNGAGGSFFAFVSDDKTFCPW